MAFRHSLTIAFLILVIPTCVAAESALVPFSARYQVKISVLRGELAMSLTKVDDHYIAKWTVEARGLTRLFVHGQIQEQADFTIVDGAVQPQHFESTDTLAGNDNTAVMDFDYDSMLASGTRNGDPFELPIEAAAFDRLSLQYALMLALLRNENPDTFLLFDDGKSKLLSISYQGPGTIAVPYGKLPVQGVQHRTQDSSRVTTLWCAESVNFLPIRIEQHKNEKLAMRADLVDYSLQ